MLAQNYFGRLLAEKRKARDLTQEEVAAVLGMTRANYSLLETGKRKDVLDPERAIKLAKLLQVDMLTLVNAMGYPVRVSGAESEDEIRLLQEFRNLEPSARRFLLRGLGL